MSRFYRRFPWILFLVFGLALALRLVFLVEQSSSPFSEFRGIDADRYHKMAVGWLEGRWPGTRPFDWPPLYSMFLGLIYKTLGQGVGTIKLVQALLGSVSCVLVYGIAWQIFSSRFVAATAALICCFCGTLIYFDSQLLSASLDVFLQLLAVFLLLLAAKRDQIGWWALAGSCLGLSAINRGGALLFLPMVVFWVFMLPRWQERERHSSDGVEPVASRSWKRVAALMVPIGLLIGPVAWHNARYDVPLPKEARKLGALSTSETGKPFAETLRQFAAGGFLRTGSVAGFNFYLGNHWELREINDVRHPDCFSTLAKIYDEPYEHGVVTLAGHDRYLMRETLEQIAQRPVDWLRLLVRKTYQFVHGAEIPRNRMIYADRQHSVVLNVLLWKHVIAFPSGLLIPLGLLGIFLARSCWRTHFLLLSCLAAQAAFVVAFYVTARYRAPTLALLSVYAGYAVVSWAGYVRRQESRSRRIFPAVLALALVVVSNIGVGEMESTPGAFEHFNYGARLYGDGEVDEAIEQYRKALRIDDGFVKAHYNLGVALASQGRIAEAIGHFSETTRLDPDHLKAQISLGVHLSGQGRTDEAIAAFREALRIDPDSVAAHHNLAVALSMVGRRTEADFHRSEARRAARSERERNRWDTPAPSTRVLP